MDFRAFRQRKFRRYDYDRSTRITAPAGPRPNGRFDFSAAAAAAARVPRNDRSGGTGFGCRRRGLDESFAAHGGPVPSRMFAQGQSRPIFYTILSILLERIKTLRGIYHILLLMSRDFNKTPC